MGETLKSLMTQVAGAVWAMAAPKDVLPAEDLLKLVDRIADDQDLVPIAMDCVRKEVQKDEGYAWGWHCNIAMAAYDAGCDHKIANEGAARFMKLLFDVDTSQFKEYQALEWKPA